MARLGTRQLIRGADIGLLTITILLVLFGLAALYSFSLTGAGDRSLLYRQAFIAALGLVGVFVFMRLDYRGFVAMHWVLYAVSLALLGAVLVFGQTVRGTTGWFSFGFFQVQPVELVKVLMALVLAKFLADRADRIGEWRTIILSGVLMAGPVGLVMLQPDLGSAIVLIGMWFGVMVVLPIPRRKIGLLMAGMAMAAIIAWSFFLQPYQHDRILDFLSPSRDPLGTGYNVRQAVTAIGSGGWFGRGLGLGPQSQLNFLPERQTDFIFATVGEELGFVGAASLLILFGLFFWRIGRLASHGRDMIGLIIAVALTSMFFLHVLINIGMNLGIFPVTGLPLPFLSYGGSSLAACLLAVGLLESIIIRQRTTPL